jgi:hypothetical protein
MNNTAIITASDFEGKALISKFVKPDALNIAIIGAQKKYLRPKIGRQQYTDLLTAFEADTLTPEQEELIAEATDMLVHRAVVYYYSVSGVTDTQSGLRINIDNNSEQLSSTQLTALMRQHEGLAASAEQDFDKWLKTTQNKGKISKSAEFVPIGSGSAARIVRRRYNQTRR